MPKSDHNNSPKKRKKRTIPLITAEKTSKENVKLDPEGFFVIEVNSDQKQIRVEHYSNVVRKNKVVSGRLQRVFVGKKADALCDTIASVLPDLQPEHYCYLGRELQKAEQAIAEDKPYDQDGA